MFEAARTSLGLMTTGERRRYWALVAARALSAVLDVAGIALVGLLAGFAGGAIGGGRSATVLGIALPPLGPAELVWLIAAVLVLFLVKALLAVAITRALARVIARIEVRNAGLIVRHILGGSLEQLKRRSRAEYQYAATTSSNWAFTGILNNVAAIIGETTLLVAVTVAFLLVDPVAAIFALVYFAAVLLVLQVLIGRGLTRSGELAASGSVGTIATIGDSLDAFREIAVLGRGEELAQRVLGHRRRYADSAASLAFLGGLPRYVVETALIVGVVLLVVQQLVSGDLATGFATLGVFLTGGVRMMASLLPLQSALSSLRVNAEQSRLAHQLLAESGRSASPPPAEVPAGPLGVQITRAGFRYADGDGSSDRGDEDHALNDLTLAIAPGSQVAIIGPSGAGKTTVADLVLGLIEPASGEVTVGGQPPAMVRASHGGLFGYVPQQPGLIAGTIAENIALGVPAAEIDREALAAAVRDAFLEDVVAALPDGLDTDLGTHADAVSGGQRQRIGLARALYSAPRLLVLDEATSGLDAVSEASIAKSLAALHGEMTIIVIAHRLSTVQHADVVHVLERGRLVASGSFAQVRASVPMVAEYVELMAIDDAG